MSEGAGLADRVQIAKERVSLAKILEVLGIEVKRKGASSFVACPKHQEKTPSCHVRQNGLWHCFGCGAGGDQVTFLEGALNLTRGDAMRKLLELAGMGDGKEIMPGPAPARKPLALARRAKPEFPELEGWNPEKGEALAKLRGLSVRAIERAARAGVLFFGECLGQQCWIVTDKERVNGQARKLNGSLWFDGVKAYTLPNAWAKWPVGVSVAGDNVLIVEGGPDILAGFEMNVLFGFDFSPVGIIGASLGIHPGALPLFSGKRVTIIPHNDDNERGSEASAGWLAQLTPVAGKVREVRIPAGIKDLNDFVKAVPASIFAATRRELFLKELEGF